MTIKKNHHIFSRTLAIISIASILLISSCGNGYEPRKVEELRTENLGRTYADIIQKYGDSQWKGEHKYMYGGSYYLLYSSIGLDQFGEECDVYFHFRVEGDDVNDDECIAVVQSTL